MSLIRPKRAADLGAFYPPPNSAAGSMYNPAAPITALRAGAAWACLRLRADLISTLPVDVFRRVNGRQVEVTKPPFFATPAAGWMWHEWLYATQFDLDRYGNVFGLVAARDALGRPAQVELTDTLDWTVAVRDGLLEYRYRGTPVDRVDVWHERQFVVPGLPIGLSPVAYAAWTTRQYLSAQQFALDWFESGASPSGTLQNTELETISAKDARIAKERFREATAHRDVFVHGKDWVYTPAAAAASDAKFLDAEKVSISDLCRFYGVPGDMIDAESSTGSVTYANVTQRNLQLLTINLGPAITRRELTFSHRLVADPRFVKFNTDAMLRMDARGKLETLAAGVDAGIYTHDEARGYLDLEPLTDEQIAKEGAIASALKSTSVPGTKTGVTP